MAKHPITIERDYARKLNKIAKVIGTIIEHHTHVQKTDGDITGVILHAGLQIVLKHYASSLEPWAQTVAKEMINRVDKQNAIWWTMNAKQFSKQLKEDRYQTINGQIATQLQHDQVALIKSLPLQAGERAQQLAIQATTEGSRASDIVGEIMRSGDVARSRAETIARTEIAKANATFTQSRAEYVGANKYIWHTMEDENVRESHAEMDGVICDYDNPPTLSDGDTGNPGEFVNCRCFAEPIISNEE
ncbi:MAG TPA: phage minor head protein [Methanosarcina sp.]|nr:phage minor head protein [Methanosarcina sp.]